MDIPFRIKNPSLLLLWPTLLQVGLGGAPNMRDANISPQNGAALGCAASPARLEI